jgi:hypothetical protein
MFTRAVTHSGHVRRFTVSDLGQDGWEVRVEHDSAVVRQLCYSDWHRVERALGMMEMEVSQLERSGWVQTAGSDAAYSTKR